MSPCPRHPVNFFADWTPQNSLLLKSASTSDSVASQWKTSSAFTKPFALSLLSFSQTTSSNFWCYDEFGKVFYDTSSRRPLSCALLPWSAAHAVLADRVDGPCCTTQGNRFHRRPATRSLLKACIGSHSNCKLLPLVHSLQQ